MEVFVLIDAVNTFPVHIGIMLTNGKQQMYTLLIHRLLWTITMVLEIMRLQTEFIIFTHHALTVSDKMFCTAS